MTTNEILPSGPTGTKLTKIKDGPMDIYVDGEWIGSRRTIKQVREALKEWRKVHGLPSPNGSSSNSG